MNIYNTNISEILISRNVCLDNHKTKTACKISNIINICLQVSKREKIISKDISKDIFCKYLPTFLDTFDTEDI